MAKLFCSMLTAKGYLAFLGANCQLINVLTRRMSIVTSSTSPACEWLKLQGRSQPALNRTKTTKSIQIALCFPSWQKTPSLFRLNL